MISFPKSKQRNILNEVKSVRKLWIHTIDNERFRTKRFLIKKRRGTQLHIRELVNFFCALDTLDHPYGSYILKTFILFMHILIFGVTYLID